MRTRVVLAAAAAVVAVGAAGAVAVPVVSGSDAASTEIRTADRPVELPPGPLPATVRRLWSAPTAGAQPSTAPAEGGTAVAGGADRVAGLDARTGREVWSYRRGNARLCGWTLRDGVVVALFGRSTGCRQLVGLDAGTGARRWYRTLELTGDAVLTSGPGIAVATAPGQLVAVDTVTGLNRWVSRGPDGCVLDPAVVGRVAVAAVARCPDGTARLAGHDAYSDKPGWTVPLPAGSEPRVVGGDESVSVLAGSTLRTYDAAGKVLGSVADRRLARTGRAPAAGVASGQTLVLWTGAAATAVDLRTRAVLWSAPADAAPVLEDDRVLLVTAPGTVSSVRLATGAAAARIEVAGAPAPVGAALARVGTLLVASAGGTVASYG